MSIDREVRKMLYNPLFKRHHPKQSKRKLENTAVKYARAKQLRRERKMKAASDLLNE